MSSRSSAGEPACTFCGKVAMIYRRYSGEWLCKRCFLASIERQVRKTIARYDLFKPDDRIAVAVSGGKDSLSLLYLLAKIEEEFPKSEVLAITVDEGIRGYRDEAVRLAEEACKRLQVEHELISFKELFGQTLDQLVKLAGKGGPSACTICGVLRRKALNFLAKKVGATKVATAHNLDDEAQTFLINLLQGDVVRAIRVGPAAREEVPGYVPRVKPLSRIPEREVALFAFLQGIRFQSSPCPYIAGTMRARIRSFLNRMEARQPGIKFSLLSSAEKLGTIVQPVEVAFRACKFCKEPAVGEVCRACELLLALGSLRAGTV